MNNPWQGTFAPYWYRWPKDTTLVEKFPEFEPRPKPVEVPMTEEEQTWADMNNTDFYAALLNEETNGRTSK